MILAPTDTGAVGPRFHLVAKGNSESVTAVSLAFKSLIFSMDFGSSFFSNLPARLLSEFVYFSK